jgi:hypothetical protein
MNAAAAVRVGSARREAFRAARGNPVRKNIH